MAILHIPLKPFDCEAALTAANPLPVENGVISDGTGAAAMLRLSRRDNLRRCDDLNASMAALIYIAVVLVGSVIAWTIAGSSQNQLSTWQSYILVYIPVIATIIGSIAIVFAGWHLPLTPLFRRLSCDLSTGLLVIQDDTGATIAEADKSCTVLVLATITSHHRILTVSRYAVLVMVGDYAARLGDGWTKQAAIRHAACTTSYLGLKSTLPQEVTVSVTLPGALF